MKLSSIRGLLIRVALGGASLTVLTVFVSAASQDRTATAGVAAGLCLALAMLGALDLESFEGLGIKAKLRSTLSDAEARLDKIDQIIKSFSQWSFLQATQDYLSDTDRKNIVDDSTSNLRMIGIEDTNIDRLKLPFYLYIASRLWFIATRVRARYLAKNLNELQSKALKLPLGTERENIYKEIYRMNSNMLPEPPSLTNLDSFQRNLERLAEEMPVREPEHQQMIASVVRDLIKTYEGCRSAKNLTDAAIETISFDSQGESKFVLSYDRMF